MHRPAFPVLVFLLLLSQHMLGQDDGTTANIISGQVIDDSLDHAIPSVHIWNESRRTGVVTDGKGAFSMKTGHEDTVVFSAIGYRTRVLVLSAETGTGMVIRLKPQTYEIGEVVVKRFRSYESFLYQVTHLDLPESEIAELKTHLKVSATTAAVEADRERAAKVKMETGGFGFVTPLGKGIDPQKIFNDKIRDLEHREQVIHAKFNRELVGDVTHLEGEALTEFIALCNFSEEFLYESDLYTIIDALYARLDDYLSRADTITSGWPRQPPAKKSKGDNDRHNKHPQDSGEDDAPVIP